MECEGYKKDYKWRSFEETSKQSRAGKAKKAAVFQFDTALAENVNPRPAQKSQVLLEKASSTGHSPISLNKSPSTAQDTVERPKPSSTSANTSPIRRFSPSQFEPLPILNPGFSPSDLDLPSSIPRNDSPLHGPFENGSGNSPFSSGSPNLADLLLPGTDMHQPPDSSELRPPMSPLPYSPGLAEPSMVPGIMIPDDDDFDEEIVRGHIIEDEIAQMNDTTGGHMQAHMMHRTDMQWTYRATSPALSDASSTSSRSTNMSILRPPTLDASSPEMLMMRFDQETCGILSIKDGPMENPWRTAIWPLAKDSHALYHAISSMTALHGATHNPQLRLAGMAHMTKSLSKLSTELAHMSLDQALATSLALALGEGWDDKISTGIQHLRGARILLNRALDEKSRNIQQGKLMDEEGAKRLKFLSNTYIYMDVIARLASAEDDDSMDLGMLSEAVNQPFDNGSIELDPLMGCATTLFPLIGKVASLVHRIYQTNSNSLKIVSEANELREQLLDWRPPDIEFIEQPNDQYSNVKHAIQTAEAYRRAILLHLHQAVPELASESSHAQAKGILTILAGTPLSSRSLIIQIFPLLVGSCEMVSKEDREWVCQRWEDMMRRLSIMNVSSCWRLVQEVWRRRDAHIQEQARKLSSRTFGRDVAPGMFIPPNLKRRFPTVAAMDDEAFFGVPDQNDVLLEDDDGRPLKRRLTFDTSTPFNAGGRSGGQTMHHSRRHTDVTVSHIDPEYTVKGHLHWLGVMSGWQWEGEFIIPLQCCCKGLVLTL